VYFDIFGFQEVNKFILNLFPKVSKFIASLIIL